jgi:circadian clock protein KaiB
MKKSDIYYFKLFISPNTILSAKALINSKSIFEHYLKGNYELEIININENNEKAIEENVITIPLLIKKKPLPEIRISGDLSDIDKVVKELLLDKIS